MHESESSDSLPSRQDSDLIIDDEGEIKRWVRPDFQFHHFIQRLTESNWFNTIIMFTIVMNAVTMAVETGDTIKVTWTFLFNVLVLFLFVCVCKFIFFSGINYNRMLS